jgi:hypothetical protein
MILDNEERHGQQARAATRLGMATRRKWRRPE